MICQVIRLMRSMYQSLAGAGIKRKQVELQRLTEKHEEMASKSSKYVNLVFPCADGF
jgi:hypothetical protein